MRRYFGTDGIRGKVGEQPITADFMLKLGWAAGRVLAHQVTRGKVVIGKDTRISGYMFESALQAGLSSAGVDIRLLGPMPTPGIAYLTRTLHAQAGIVISASHNPYFDNGIKFFAGDGSKLPDEVEAAIEAELEKPMHTVDSALLGKAKRIDDAAGRYIEFCKSTTPNNFDLRGLKIVVDCAHGATYQVAPSVFHELGADVIRIGADPDGLNINQNCGSTHPELLQRAVHEHGADIGIALDGDGDRVIMIDEKGQIVDGDQLLFIIACARRQAGDSIKAVVGTQMSNLGLELALKELGLGFHRAKVGDRYVLEMMRETGCHVGGESSGHVICLDRTSTGDGIVSALQVLTAMVTQKKSLHTLKSGMKKMPQILVNVRVEGAAQLIKNTVISAAVSEQERRLGQSGRILLRASGTEPVVRVMVEGSNEVIVTDAAQTIAAAVRMAAAADKR